jgi:hypothetical protein
MRRGSDPAATRSLARPSCMSADDVAIERELSQARWAHRPEHDRPPWGRHAVYGVGCLRAHTTRHRIPQTYALLQPCNHAAAASTAHPPSESCAGKEKVKDIPPRAP